jgi:predicted flap endonuclease-1-like 5' DNA nuclease
MSDLFRIKGVGGQYAELLEAAGVDAVKELRNRNAENLAEKMGEVNAEKRLVRQVPNLERVESWVQQAKQLEPAVFYGSGAPGQVTATTFKQRMET